MLSKILGQTIPVKAVALEDREGGKERGSKEGRRNHKVIRRGVDQVR